MEYHQDWFMRQIQMLVAFLIRLLSGGDDEKELESKLEESEIFGRLQALLALNEICKAEDLLYELVDGENMDAFYGGLQFYLHLSRFSEAQLKAYNFSREEIKDGLRELCIRYGISEDILSIL